MEGKIVIHGRRWSFPTEEYEDMKNNMLKIKKWKDGYRCLWSQKSWEVSSLIHFPYIWKALSNMFYDETDELYVFVLNQIIFLIFYNNNNTNNLFYINIQ